MYYEKARELGQMILESDFSKNLADARAVYDGDEEAIKLMNDYVAYQDNIRESMEKGALTQEQLEVSTQRLSEMVHELKKHPVVGALVSAENEFNGFVNQVMNVLKETIMGKPEGSGCSPSACSSCSGCH